uniref:UBC core domain-containing protein n=1 Tax=Calcidiscus leptoporus TaxID=127549 RepID=A0A7S0NXP8_9EUKA
MAGLAQLHEAAHHVLRAPLTAGGAHKDKVLSWLSEALMASRPRASAIHRSDHFKSAEQAAAYQEAMRTSSTDEFVCNLASVLLRFCAPFLRFGEAPAPATLAKLSVSHYRGRDERLDYSPHSRLCGHIVGGGGPSAAASELEGGSLFGELDAYDGDVASAGTFSRANAPLHFVGEMFFLTQYAFHIAMVPTVRHLFFHTGRRRLQLERGGMAARDKDIDLYRMQECYTVLLLEPQQLQLSIDFILLQAAWLAELSRGAQASQAFELVPQFVVLDAAAWLVFVAQFRPEELALHPLHSLTANMVVLLRAGCPELCSGARLIRSPLVLAALVNVLYKFVVPPSSRPKEGLLGAGGWGGDVNARLSQSVLGVESLRAALPEPLLAVYSAVDSIEGLDVDAVEAEAFDKWNVRMELNTLLLHLWTLPEAKKSIVDIGIAAADDGSARRLLLAFCNGTLDTLLYELEEALKRIAEIKRAADVGGDASAAADAQHQHNVGYIRHLLHTATATLQLIGELVTEPSLAAAYASGSLSHRTAKVVITFVGMLVGKRSLDLKLKASEDDFGFDPRQLLQGMSRVLLRCAVHAPLIAALADDDDLDMPVLHKAASTLSRLGLLQADEMDSLHEVLHRVATHRTPSVDGIGSSSNAIAATIPADTTDALAKLEAELGPPVPAASVSSEDVEGYVGALSELAFDEAELLAEEAVPQYHYKAQAGQAQSALPALRKALMHESKALGDGQLPCHPDASIFVRVDEARLDVWRALLTGPVDTPYALGLFLFDVYCPAEYPSISPLVHFETTNGGTVKFNPNLYADGKVCLSLLGTFTGTDATQKWDPKRSSLYQVFVSIQSQILTPHPLANEPGYEALMSTPTWKQQSAEYNAKLRLYTMRYAMLGPLRAPPRGFEDVVRLHFKLQRARILQQCWAWTQEAPMELRDKMCHALNALRDALDAAATAAPLAVAMVAKT